MLAALLTLALLAPADDERVFQLELTVALDGAATPVTGLNGTFFQGSVGPGGAARLVLGDVFWIEAWAAAGYEIVHLQLTPLLRQAQLGPTGRLHGSVSVGWRWELADGFTFGVGGGPSVDTFSDVGSDTFGLRNLLGFMPVVLMRWRLREDLHLEAHAATNLALTALPLRANAMWSLGISWTFK